MRLRAQGSGLKPKVLSGLLCALALTASVGAQEAQPPTLQVGALPDTLVVDGILNEPAWNTAPVADNFTQSEPSEGAAPLVHTAVRVLAGLRALAIGIVCDDPDPKGIVSFSVRRDASLNNEDHVRIVLGPFLDGRSGYVFAVNPSGARYDGLVNPGGENDNADWDGIWEAATARTETGWSVEIRIPMQTLSFRPGLHECTSTCNAGFNGCSKPIGGHSPRASTRSRRQAAPVFLPDCRRSIRALV